MAFEIITERLRLRDHRVDDWEQVHSYASIPQFSQYEIWGPNTVFETKKYIADVIQQTKEKNRYKFDCAVCLKDDDILIGGCGIRRETEKSAIANMGWAIHPDFQGKGVATEAAAALIEFGWKQLDLLLIYATCDTRNLASARVMEKLGMHWVGIIKGTQEIKGHKRDCYRYEIARGMRQVGKGYE